MHNKPVNFKEGFMEVILSFFAQVFLVLSLIGFGFQFSQILKIDKNEIAGEKQVLIWALLGFLYITFFVTALNFFLPVPPIFSGTVLTIGLILFFVKFKELEKHFNIKLFKAFLLILVLMNILYLSYGFKAFDTGAYHIQSVKWVSESITPLGLANLMGNLGYTSLSFSGLAVTDFILFITDKPLFILYPALFSLFFACIYVSRKRLAAKSDIFFILSVLPLFMQSRRFGSFAADNSVLIYTLVTIYLCIVLYEKEHSQASEVSLKSLITLLASFSFTIKLSSAPICLIPIYFLGEIFIKRAKLRKAFLITGCLCILLAIMFFVKSYMLSGYPAYPHPAFAIDKDWTVPRAQAVSEKTYISNYPKHDIRAFDEEYIKSWKWFPRYLLKYSVYDRGLLIFFCLTLFIVFAGFYNSASLKSFLLIFKNKSFIFPFIITSIGILFWLFTAPGPRFAYGNLFGFLMLIVSQLLYVKPDLSFDAGLRNIISKGLAFIAVISLTLALTTVYDNYFSSQKFLKLLLTYYDNLDIQKLQLLFPLFIGFLLIIFIFAAFFCRHLLKLKNIITLKKNNVLRAVFYTTLTCYFLFEIPVIFSPQNIRFNFPEIKLNLLVDGEYPVYFVEYPHLGFNKTIFSTNRRTNLKVEFNNGRYKFIYLPDN